MQSDTSGKRKFSGIKQWKADIAKQEMELAEQKQEIARLERLEEKQKVLGQAAKLREQAEKLERKAAVLDQQAAAKTQVSTNTVPCVTAPVSASVAASVAASVSESVSKTSSREQWVKLTKELERKADKPRNDDDGRDAWLGGPTFFELNCQLKPNDPDCLGEHCYHPIHDREIWDLKNNPTGNVMRFDNFQMQRRSTPTVTDARLGELQKQAEENYARNLKKEERAQKLQQSAANGGAAVSAASGASARKPITTYSQIRGGRGGKFVGAPRKCPAGKTKKSKTFVSYAERTAEQVKKLVEEYKPMNAEQRQKILQEAKTAFCDNYPCFGGDEKRPMQLNPDGHDGSSFSWECNVCGLIKNKQSQSNILKALRDLGLKIF
jgi:hypothetical protein